MILYPAIDLINQKCVRLYQGDFDKKTEYEMDPIQRAKTYEIAGASWLHLVDLNAAKQAEQAQTHFIIKIIESCDLSIQVGGGIRREEQIYELLNKGAARVVVGSKAVTDPEMVAQWLCDFGPQKICLAFDLKVDAENRQKVSIDAWKTQSKMGIDELISYYLDYGLKHVLCTDIACDGALTGPNFAVYDYLQIQYPQVDFQASGGIASLSDLQVLKQKKLAGAVMGRALYEDKFTLTDALKC